MQVSLTHSLCCPQGQDLQDLRGQQGVLLQGHSPRSYRRSTPPFWPSVNSTSGRGRAATSWGTWSGRWRSHWTWQPGREENCELSSQPSVWPAEFPWGVILNYRYTAGNVPKTLDSPWLWVLMPSSTFWGNANLTRMPGIQTEIKGIVWLIISNHLSYNHLLQPAMCQTPCHR